MGSHVLGDEVQENSSTRSIPPVPLEIRGDGELGHNVDASIPHTSISLVSRAGINGAGSICVGEDSVTSFEKGEGGEHGANLRWFVC